MTPERTERSGVAPPGVAPIAGPRAAPTAGRRGPPAAGESLAAPPVALYVHVPFCVSHCPYCDFVVYAGSEARGPRARIAPFVEALRTEIALRADALDELFRGEQHWGERAPLASVYLGGGTPSLLPPDAIRGLLDLVRARFGIAPDAEVTLEANPGPDEIGSLEALAGAGVTRLSIGAQSLHPAELRRLGRRHSPGDVARAVAEARAAGIGSVSLDLLYDIPGQPPERWTETLAAALALRPDHISLYALTLDDPDEEGITGAFGDHLPTPPGARRWREKARIEQDDDRAAAMYEVAAHLLDAAGWRGYEISNWARRGQESRHNLAYWERRPYEAVGPGAHAFDGAVRRWNAARLDRYLAALAPPAGRAPSLPPGGSEAVTPEAAAAERAILGLRLDAGLPASLGEEEPLRSVRDWAREAGLLEDAVDAAGEHRLRLTLRGRLLSNEVFARLV